MDRNQENKAIVRQFADCLSKDDQTCLYDTLADDYVHHAYDDTYRGKESWYKAFKDVRAAFPDVSFTVEDQVAEGDKVVNRITIDGTHKGEFNGIPATNKRVTTTGMGMFYLRDGKIYEQYSEINLVRLMGQIGNDPGNGPMGK
jgi:steroid delta-isomerase-like uncharacterized protein